MKVTLEQKKRILERVRKKAKADLNNPKLARVARMTLNKLK